MFSGEGPIVGEFTCQDSKVSMEIFPAAEESKDNILNSILQSMKNKIDTEYQLDELIRTNSPHSSLQYYKY